jgi:hypothetical protein
MESMSEQKSYCDHVRDRVHDHVHRQLVSDDQSPLAHEA